MKQLITQYGGLKKEIYILFIGRSQLQDTFDAVENRNLV